LNQKVAKIFKANVAASDRQKGSALANKAISRRS